MASEKNPPTTENESVYDNQITFRSILEHPRTVRILQANLHLLPLPTRTGDTEEELISMSWSRKFSLTKLKISARMLQNGLNWYPPWIGAGIRITDMQPDFRKARVTMPLTFYNRNFVGTQFGGSLYSMCDPLISKSNQLLNCDMKHR